MNVLFVSQGFDQRIARDRVRINQCRTAEVDQRCDLLCRLSRPGLQIHRTHRKQPAQGAEGQQHRHHDEGAPKQIQPPSGMRARRLKTTRNLGLDCRRL